jgi:hypothetical protein
MNNANEEDPSQRGCVSRSQPPRIRQWQVSLQLGYGSRNNRENMLKMKVVYVLTDRTHTFSSQWLINVFWLRGFDDGRLEPWLWETLYCIVFIVFRDWFRFLLQFEVCPFLLLSNYFACVNYPQNSHLGIRSCSPAKPLRVDWISYESWNSNIGDYEDQIGPFVGLPVPTILEYSL